MSSTESLISCAACNNNGARPSPPLSHGHEHASPRTSLLGSASWREEGGAAIKTLFVVSALLITRSLLIIPSAASSSTAAASVGAPCRPRRRRRVKAAALCAPPIWGQPLIGRLGLMHYACLRQHCSFRCQLSTAPALCSGRERDASLATRRRDNGDAEIGDLSRLCVLAVCLGVLRWQTCVAYTRGPRQWRCGFSNEQRMSFH